MRVLAATIVLLCACERQPQPGPPVHLVAGASDTVVVNSRYPMALPVRALDAMGRTVAGAPIRYTWAGHDSLPVTATGAVTCTRSGDFAVRAALGPLTLRLVVQCRRVEYVRMSGPLQFVLGDSALSQPFAIRFVAYGADARPIAPVMAGVSVGNTGIASFRGLLLSPREREITWANVRVGGYILVRWLFE
jgi:hypothetical protein